MTKTAKGYGRDGQNTVPRSDPAYYQEYRQRNPRPPKPLQPCARCGGPKERGRCRQLCDGCRAWREANPTKRVAEIERNAKLKKAYGISSKQFDEMLEAQGGRCAICRTDQPGGRGRFHVDHDHETSRVRGLLCHYCNTAIGSLRDDPELLRAAITYLEGTRSWP